MRVAHQFRIMLAGGEARNRVHRPGPVKRDDGSQILDALRLQPHANGCDAARLHLKHTGGAPLLQHFICFSVPVRDLFQLEGSVRFSGHFHGVVQNGQVAQAQKIHLEQAKLLKRRHGILADDGVVVPRKRHIGHHRLFRNHNAGCMGRRVARHTFQSFRRVD